MTAIKKSVLAAAFLMSMGAGAAQAAIATYGFTGAFVMFSGADPTFSDPSQVVDNGNGIAGDAVSGYMYFDTLTGAGTATITPSVPFFGDWWSATGITLQATGNPGEVNFSMLFNWGAPDAGPGSTSYFGGVDNGLGSGTCGVANCDIGVTGTFQMYPTATPGVSGFYTTASSMPAGPFAGFQPTFNGLPCRLDMPCAYPPGEWQGWIDETVPSIPEPETYGMMLAGLRLVGFAARRRKPAKV